MPIGEKPVTGEDVRDIANGVGLDRVGWDGSLLYLFLQDGSSIEISSVFKNAGAGAKSEKAKSPALLFLHRRLRPLKPSNGVY